MIPRNYLLVMIVMVLASAAFGIVCYREMPDRVPTHWNIHGEVDGYGPPWQAALLLPAVNAGMAGLFVLLPWIGPFKRNFERFRFTYARICVTIAAMLAAIHVLFALASMGWTVPIGPTVAVLAGVMLMLLGNWLGKIRRNFYVGIRTPWTLASEAVWERTHRLGGKLMFVQGLVTAVAGLFLPSWLCFIVVIGGCLLIVVWAVIYSFYLYRRLGEVDDLP